MIPARAVSPSRPNLRTATLVAALAGPFVTRAHAQQPPADAPPAAAPAPSWQQGRSSAQDKSTLHPFAPLLTGRAASELPLDKLKVPAGFKVEVWADGV